jgi:L-amino acid N-acyltransferase YncA
VDLRIRDATEADLPAIVDIYNQSIPAGWSTADTQPIAVADRVEWFRKFDPARRPIWVADVDGRVVATAYLSSFYGGRPAYDATAEISTYIATAYHRRGIGRRLKQWVIEQCPRLRVTTLLSMHFDHNEATPRINESLGFERMGHLTEIALVHGQKRGLVIWALRIPPRSAEAGAAPAPGPRQRILGLYGSPKRGGELLVPPWDFDRMKVYWLAPPEGSPWLAPEQVVARWRSSFPRVRSDAAAAQERGRQFLARYRALLDAGLGDRGSTPLEAVERQWSGALLVEVWADEEGGGRFQTVAFTEYRLELEFGRGVPGRSRRSLASRAARALGYVVASVDGD